jgi:hypothetical protein
MMNEFQTTIIRPDYSRSFFKDSFLILIVQFIIFYLCDSAHTSLQQTLATILLLSAGMLFLFFLQCYLEWGTIFLNEKGLTIRQFWGNQFYSWPRVESIYVATAFGGEGGERKIFIETINTNVGQALTAYPYCRYSTEELVEYLNQYRQNRQSLS